MPTLSRHIGKQASSIIEKLVSRMTEYRGQAPLFKQRLFQLVETECSTDRTADHSRPRLDRRIAAQCPADLRAGRIINVVTPYRQRNADNDEHDGDLLVVHVFIPFNLCATLVTLAESVACPL